MSALDDIRKALGSLSPVAAGKKRFVVVGPSAMRSLCCATPEGERPTSLSNSDEQYPILETEEFEGWEIVERPVVERYDPLEWLRGPNHAA